MVVMGPSYSDRQVEDLYNEVMLLLRKHGIQAWDIPNNNPYPWPDWQKLRDSRNARLRRAIEKLVELQSWEDF